ncbi:PACE efflux transporter [Shewanella youngdeokensis]|uniref:PACE efflux transporter n=1 Tax=Shewanella youngdeokensis TaxID=2999068 RepID=A0ABZ0JXD6_9GAMM|nr:PACE efflux transporter [Shewanella sp. DAU334]
MSIVERIFHSVLLEVLAVTFSVIGLAIFTDHKIEALSGTMIVIATIAMVWNYIYNWFFDQFAKGDKLSRSFGLRIMHVTLFEVGLLVITIPVMAYLLAVSLWQAFIMDIGVTIFITIYVFIYNLVYDHVRAYVIQRRSQSLTCEGSR